MNADEHATTPLVCRLEPVPQIPHRHPLATRSGIEALSQIIAADRHWRPLSTRCRDALRAAYMQALRDALATGTNEVALPLVPKGTHPATMRSLTRRGLVADGRLTALAVEVTRWAPKTRGRPVSTAQPVGGAL